MGECQSRVGLHQHPRDYGWRSPTLHTCSRRASSAFPLVSFSVWTVLSLLSSPRRGQWLCPLSAPHKDIDGMSRNSSLSTCDSTETVCCTLGHSYFFVSGGRARPLSYFLLF